MRTFVIYGALGCAKSHEAVLSSASILEDQLLMICEDDCQFIADRAAIDAAIEEFFYNPHLDVLCLAYNAKNGFAISQNLMITSDTQTMSCYISRSARSRARRSARENPRSVSMLAR